MNNGLMKLFGGVSYDPDLKEMGFPLHYLILLSEITLWIGVSSVEELHTKGCGELIRFGRTSYWRKRSLILLAQGVEFFLLVIMCIIFFPGDIPFGRTIGFLDCYYIVFKGFPVLVIIMQVILTLQIIVNPGWAMFMINGLMIILVSVRKRIVLLDLFFIKREGATINPNDWMYLLFYWAIWGLAVEVGVWILRNKEVSA